MSFLLHEAVDALGFTPYFHQQYLELRGSSSRLEGLVPERVTSEQRGQYQLAGMCGSRRAVVSGRLSADSYDGLRPCVGDFVLASGDAELGRIEHVLVRSSVLQRRAINGSSSAQPVAANVDLVIVVGALASDDAHRRTLDRGLNPRRIERYLRAAREAPARALVVVNKADLRADAADQLAELRRELGVEALLVSAVSGAGLDELAQRIEPRTTAVVVGSSGVGKSSLLNHLLGQRAQRVEALREDDARGRHTTTGRELFVLPGGGILIDTPGMRELGLFADETSDLAQTGFSEIDRYAAGCHFRDCRHQGEPGCAVRAALKSGAVSDARLEHAHKLQRELARQQRLHELQRRRVEKRASRRARQAHTTDDDE